METYFVIVKFKRLKSVLKIEPKTEGWITFDTVEFLTADYRMIIEISSPNLSSYPVSVFPEPLQYFYSAQGGRMSLGGGASSWVNDWLW